MVNNFALVCNNIIIDIFYNVNEENIHFAPLDLEGNPINLIPLSQIISDKQPLIGDIINTNYEIITEQIKEEINLIIKEFPKLEEDNEDYSSILEMCNEI